MTYTRARLVGAGGKKLDGLGVRENILYCKMEREKQRIKDSSSFSEEGLENRNEEFKNCCSEL